MKSLLLLPLLPLLAAPAPQRIAGVEWHATLASGREAAAPLEGRKKRKARPILYLRMLGDLAGKT